MSASMVSKIILEKAAAESAKAALQEETRIDVAQGYYGFSIIDGQVKIVSSRLNANAVDLLSLPEMYQVEALKLAERFIAKGYIPAEYHPSNMYFN